jgi:DNA-binding NtrC family response regulator
LRRSGYKIFDAESAVAGRSIWEQHWREIDLLLTDLVLPGGVSGVEFAHECRTTKPELKVVYTSGYSTEFPQVESALRNGARFLPKPYQFASLNHVVRECLDGSQVQG